MEEKALFEWASKVSKKYVTKDIAQEIHDKAAPFLTWLKEAEEEESESDEEDDDLEVHIYFSFPKDMMYHIEAKFFLNYMIFFRLSMTTERKNL